MIRNYKNYNIQQRKDGRYTVTITDHDNRTYFYGRTKKEVPQKLELFVAELNNAAQLQYELNNPRKYMSLKNWAHICLNNYCIASIQGNTYIAYERLIRMHFGELGDIPIGRITNLMIQNHITKLSRLVDENELSENYLTRLRTFMHMVFEYAVQNNLITHNPANGDRWINTGYVFTRDDGHRMNPDSTTSWLSGFAKRHNLPHINPHAFRHTAASVLLASGTDIVTVSKQLGHASVSTTENFYSHIIEENKAKATECLADKLLRKNA